MQLGQHHLHRRHPLAVLQRHLVHRNPAPVVHHRDRVILVDRHVDPRRIPRQRLVHRVVHHLVHQVVQPHLARRPDIHRRAQPHRLQALQHLDVLARVRAVPAVRPRTAALAASRVLRRLHVCRNRILHRCYFFGCHETPDFLAELRIKFADEKNLAEKYSRHPERSAATKPSSERSAARRAVEEPPEGESVAKRPKKSNAENRSYFRLLSPLLYQGTTSSLP